MKPGDAQALAELEENVRRFRAAMGEVDPALSEALEGLRDALTRHFIYYAHQNPETSLYWADMVLFRLWERGYLKYLTNGGQRKWQR